METTIINGVKYNKQLLPLFDFTDINLKITLRFGERCKICNKLIPKDTLKLSLKRNYEKVIYNFCINCSKTILKEFDKCKMWKLEQQLKINAFIDILNKYTTKDIQDT